MKNGRQYFLHLFCVAVLLIILSCIKDEPLNRETDILSIFSNNEKVLDFIAAEDSNNIHVLLTSDVDVTQLTLEFKLTQGASIHPASGSVQDFSNQKEIHYTVTAEDGGYKKTYVVNIIQSLALKWGFEEWEYYKPPASSSNYLYPVLKDDNSSWATANSGVFTVSGIIKPTYFPTDRTTNKVGGNYAAKLETIKGGEVLGMHMPIFAGSLFRGKFSANLSNPLKSLKLGRAHSKEMGKPVFFTGYYKYAPGAVFTDKSENVIPDKTDEMSMYAVIFRVTKGVAASKEHLDGITIFTSDRVVGRADWTKETKASTEIATTPNGFIKFKIPFIYNQVLDHDAYDYRLTIVASSSKDGNLYEGSVGSTLILDDFEIVCEPIL